jgi:predicted nucleic acid-binding protein
VNRALLDSNVVLYAIGGPHPYAEPCRRILALAGENRVRLEAPVDLIQEVMHHRARRLGDRAQATADARAAAELCQLHAVEPRDAREAANLFADSTRLSARDAIFAAIAIRHGLPAIVSADSDFDELAGLQRIDPCDSAALAALTAPA